MKDLQTIVREATEYLAKHRVDHARHDTEWLVASAMGLTRVTLYMNFDKPLVETELAKIRPLLKRRALGEPLQYILGNTPFYNVDLLVGPGCLVPRPETEQLVDFALAAYPKDATGPVLDLCTGSGAVALAIAKERPSASRIVAVDLSPEALVWARKNAAALALPQVDIREGDLYAPVAGERFALITANPPYIAPSEFATLQREVRDHEPRLALVAADEGLAILRRLVAAAPAHLEPGGWLFCELGTSQGPAAKAMAEAAGLTEVRIRQDHAHHDRVLQGRLPL